MRLMARFSLQQQGKGREGKCMGACACVDVYGR